MSSELDITIHVIVSQLSGNCDVINNRLWRDQQNVNLASEARGRCMKIVVFIVILSSLCRVRNEIMYVLEWRTISALTRVLFWCLFPSLLRNSGNKHQNNPLVSAETVRHSSTHIILYIPALIPVKNVDKKWSPGVFVVGRHVFSQWLRPIKENVLTQRHVCPINTMKPRLNSHQFVDDSKAFSCTNILFWFKFHTIYSQGSS